VVLLDFWTFCCINCLHTLGVLAALERELEGEPFVAIGVHSPKFPNEGDPDMVREAVRRYGVTHPVVVDSEHAVWSRYGVRAWPTLALVDPEGYLVGGGSGEPDRVALVRAIRRVLAEARTKGTLTDRALPLRREPVPAGSLAYPGKVIAPGDLVLVADTGHDQVVVCDAGGAERDRVGSGQPGFADGRFADARFHHPNGLALAGGTLYIADTGNHAIRAVDLERGTVRTVAGTGAMGRGPEMRAGPGREVALRSPWDLAWDGRRLYVAMAGSHQIWTFDPASGAVAPFAGTGAEVGLDGPAHAAAFAQPSGLALLDGVLFVADSEISSIRAISGLDGEPVVRTVCGTGELFGYGDRDGAGSAALLQHPIGIAAGDGALYVADTYNHKIKVVDPATGECATLFGNGEPERLPELVPGYPLARADAVTPGLFEPEGLAYREGALLVADTNNHRLVAVSLADGARRVLAGG
jgi:DNA-binding beta-propeller fold protein YncE